MTRVKVNFRDTTPDEELSGIRTIKFLSSKEIKFVYMSMVGDGLTSKTWKIEQISYIEVGNG